MVLIQGRGGYFRDHWELTQKEDSTVLQNGEVATNTGHRKRNSGLRRAKKARDEVITTLGQESEFCTKKQEF